MKNFMEGARRKLKSVGVVLEDDVIVLCSLASSDDRAE